MAAHDRHGRAKELKVAMSPLEFLKGGRSDERVARIFSRPHRKAED